MTCQMLVETKLSAVQSNPVNLSCRLTDANEHSCSAMHKAKLESGKTAIARPNTRQLMLWQAHFV